MGSKNSTEAKTHPSVTCTYCAFRSDDGGDVCKRCSGLLPKGRRLTKVDPATAEGYDKLEDKVQEEKHLPLKRMLLLPFKETLPQEDGKEMTEEKLLRDFIVPYFKDKNVVVRAGERFQIKEVDFQVIQCLPPQGKVVLTTQIRAFGAPLVAEQKVVNLHILPCLNTIPGGEAALRDTKDYEPARLFRDYVKPYFTAESRYIVKGDSMVIGGLQFCIIAAEPFCGEVTRETKIFTDGPPLKDMVKIQIAPYLETLPASERKISEADVLSRYIAPYFSGRNVFVTEGEEILINGVKFLVQVCEPKEGIITCQTQFFADQIVKLEDIQRERLRADEEFARQLQQQESNPQMRLLHMRLQEIMHRLPHDDPHRGSAERLFLQSLILSPIDFQQFEGFSQAPAAAPQSAIQALPTRIYRAKKSPPTDDGKKDKQDEEFNTCRVCLNEYEDGEELRTLPCFHAYHKICIDKWLSTNRTCPICKNPITTTEAAPTTSRSSSSSTSSRS